MRIVVSFLVILLMFVIGCSKLEVKPSVAKEQKATEKIEQQAQKGEDDQQQEVLNSLIDRVK
jgi:Na+-transporting methylmalonyl-CoA/oxaloacetate decarboxylase gamma subunit